MARLSAGQHSAVAKQATGRGMQAGPEHAAWSQARAEAVVPEASASGTAGSDGTAAEIVGVARRNAEIISNFVQRKPNNVDLLSNLPPSEDYTWDEAGSEVQSRYRKEALFLGEENNIQTWSRLKTFTSRQDEIELLTIDISTQIRTVHRGTIQDIPLMYPFKVFQDVGGSYSRKYVYLLVKYVYIEAGKTTVEFREPTLKKFVLALREIQRSYEGKGGAENVPDIQVPSVMPSQMVVDDSRNEEEASAASDHSMHPRYGQGHEVARSTSSLSIATEDAELGDQLDDLHAPTNERIEDDEEEDDEDSLLYHEISRLIGEQAKLQAQRRELEEAHREYIAALEEDERALEERRRELSAGKDLDWWTNQMVKHNTKLQRENDA